MATVTPYINNALIAFDTTPWSGPGSHAGYRSPMTPDEREANRKRKKAERQRKRRNRSR